MQMLYHHLNIASNEMLKKELDDVLETLTDREERVLRLRFGLEDGRTRTLEEVEKNSVLLVSVSVRSRLKHYVSYATPSRSRR